MKKTTTKTAATRLNTKALTVTLNICSWGGRKIDKKITREVADTHNADHDAGRYNKLLVAKKYLDPISKIDNAARTFHYENTLPWGDNGERLLSSENFMNYTQKIAQFKNEREAAIRNLVSIFDEVKDDAKIRLNGMYEPNDYPNPVELESNYTFNTCFLPLPETDIRLNLSQTEVNILTQQIENTFKERTAAAVADIWERIKKQLDHMKAKLTERKEDGTAGVFRNSLFDNLRDIVSLLPRLNVTEDENLTAICNEMQTLLVDPEAVRTNSNLRNEKANEVENLLNKFSDFFG